MISSDIAYAEHGGGGLRSRHPPLLLIHGAGGNRFHWPPELRRMDGVRVLCPDLPGHGESPGGGREIIADYYNAVRHWLEDLRLQRAIWVGHSMGGAIAILAALRSPESVTGLVLVGSGGRLRVHPTLLEMTGTADQFDHALDLVTKWAFGEGAATRLVELARARMSETRPEVLHGDFLACNSFDALSDLSRITAPTLVVCGTQDQLTPVKYSRTLAESIPNASLEIIEGAGHMVMLEKPETLARVVAEFLAKLPSRE